METQCKILAYHSGAVDNRSLVVCDAVLTGKLLRTAVTIDQRRTLFTVREEIYFEGQIAFLNTNSPPPTDQSAERHEKYKQCIYLKDTVMRTNRVE